jgi:hypothetical protein
MFRKDPAKETAKQQENVVPLSLAVEDETLLAVLMAAVVEYESTNNFKVLSILPSTDTWKFTARQEGLQGSV